MADINFLSENKGGDSNGRDKKRDDEKKEFEWTEPAKDIIKKDKFKELPHKKEDKSSPVLPSHKEGLISSSSLGKFHGLADRNKLDHSRQEVVKALQAKEENGKSEKIAEEKRADKKNGLFSWLRKIFKNNKPKAAPEENLDKYLKDGENIKKAEREPFRFRHKDEEKRTKPKIDKSKLFFHREKPEKEEKAKKEEKIEIKPEKIAIKKEKPEESKANKLSWLDKLLNFFKSIGKFKKQEKIKIEIGIKEDKKPSLPLNNVIKEVAKEAPAPEKPKVKETAKIWENPKILETNLIKGEVSSFFNWEKGILILIFYLTGACILVGGSYAGLIMWEKKANPEKVVSNRIEEMKKEIEPLEATAKKIAIFQGRLKLVGELLRDHIYWTNFFEFLEDGTMPNVTYKSISGNVEGAYTFLASAKNYRAMVDQVNFFRIKDYVKLVQVSEGKYSDQKEQIEKDAKTAVKKEEAASTEVKPAEESVNFDMKLEVDPEIFTKGPFIDKVEPMSGARGQYISIYGINFRKYQEESSSVQFYNVSLKKYIDASVDFPSNCLDGWWTNSYIVIKVPKLSVGSWQIVVKNKEGEAIYRENFNATDGTPGPGICLVDPRYGYKGKTFSIYGENFGSSENKGIIKIGDFSSEASSWSDSQVTGEIPDGAQSGAIILNTGKKEASNSFPYIQLY